MKYTIVDYFGYDLSPQERMKAIKRAGFDGVILLWADYFDADYRDFPQYAENAGLYVENAHAPYMQANTIWEDTITGQEYTNHIIIFILAYARCNLGDDLFIYMLLNKYPNNQFYIHIKDPEHAQLFEQFSNITIIPEKERTLTKENQKKMYEEINI